MSDSEHGGPMKEHPMLMKGPLVRATLAGRKTQTRRLVTPQNSIAEGWVSAKKAWPLLDWSQAKAGVRSRPGKAPVGVWMVPMLGGNRGAVQIMPRVQPGHALWIRETWRPTPASWVAPPLEIEYAADGTDRTIATEAAQRWFESSTHVPGRWRPAIHMPRWACRLVLPVTSVMAERLQEITEEDAETEGIERGHDGWWNGSRHPVKGTPKARLTARVAFADLWEEINGNRECARWADNPPLWVYGWEALG